MIPIGLSLLALLLLFLIAHDVLFPASPVGAVVNTATVTQGTVRSAVSGTGTVSPAQQQNVNFAVAGTLVDIGVKAGDRVTKGQVLAKLDPAALQQALDQANNGLVQAQATLSSTVNGNAIVQAQHSLANAQQSLADTQGQVNLTNQQDASTLAADQAQLGTDQANLTAAQSALAAGGCSAVPAPANCAQLQQNVTQAQQAVNTSSQKVTQDQNRIATDKLNGQRSINQATNAVTQAQDALNSQTIQRPNTIASQQASVSNAQLAIQTAQRNLNFATLTAPFDGTVLAINAQVGDGVSAGGGGTASQSSASSATSQSGASGAGAGGTSGGTNGSTTGGSSTSSTGSGFVVLGDLSGFQVVVPFAEADASRVQANQQATVTFDAVTGLTLQGHVLSVAQIATVVSNVTNYAATLALDQVDQRLRSGMTANASVVVQQAQNVMVLPNSVITRTGGVAFVTLLGKDGKAQTRQRVQTGAVGDTMTEITSGLNLGDRVVRPQLRTTTGGASGAAGGRGLGGGGGGVRIGG